MDSRDLSEILSTSGFHLGPCCYLKPKHLLWGLGRNGGQEKGTTELRQPLSMSQSPGQFRGRVQSLDGGTVALCPCREEHRRMPPCHLRLLKKPICSSAGRVGCCRSTGRWGMRAVISGLQTVPLGPLQVHWSTWHWGQAMQVSAWVHASLPSPLPAVSPHTRCPSQ